jgi:hypothetical protein
MGWNPGKVEIPFCVRNEARHAVLRYANNYTKVSYILKVYYAALFCPIVLFSACAVDHKFVRRSYSKYELYEIKSYDFRGRQQ